MGKDFQKSALPTFLHFVRVRAAHQPHVFLSETLIASKSCDNFRSHVEQTPLEWENVSYRVTPWKKVEFWRNKTFFGPTFPFPWSPGLSSLAAPRRQLSCRSRKMKSCPSESLVPPQFHSFRGNPVRIYILWGGTNGCLPKVVAKR